MSIKNNDPVIDFTILDELKSALQVSGKPDVLIELLTLFLESAEELAKKIYPALKNRDLQTLADAAHSLKSSSANVGAHQLSALCLEIEKIGEKKIPCDDFELLYKRFDQKYLATVSELKAIKMRR